MNGMFEGSAMVLVWLMTPAIVGIGSFGAAVAFLAIPKLWGGDDEGDASERR
jgi:hypothetical protein